MPVETSPGTTPVMISPNVVDRPCLCGADPALAYPIYPIHICSPLPPVCVESLEYGNSPFELYVWEDHDDTVWDSADSVLISSLNETKN